MKRKWDNEKMKKVAISLAKKAAVGVALKIITNEENKKMVKDKLLEKVMFSIYGTNQDVNHYTICKWLIGLNHPIIKKYISYSIIGRNDIAITAVKSGKFRVFVNNTLLTIESGTESIVVGDESNGPDRFISVDFIGQNAKKMYEEIRNELDDYTDAQSKNSISVSEVPNVYNFMPIKGKSLDNIFSDQKDSIVKFIKDWQTKKDIYDKKELPYKTGILLYGVPGTGKTSLVKALATNLNMKIIYVDPINLREGDFRHINIPDKSIIFIEEIDKILKDKSDIAEKKIFSLMQLLDGIRSPENVMFIATTNKFNMLPESLIRDSRFDIKIEMTNICKETAIKMCKSFDMDESILEKCIIDKNGKYNPANIQTEILKTI